MQYSSEFFSTKINHPQGFFWGGGGGGKHIEGDQNQNCASQFLLLSQAYSQLKLCTKQDMAKDTLISYIYNSYMYCVCIEFASGGD